VIIDSHTTRRGNKVIVHAICRNVQVDGQWVRIEDVLTVKRTGRAYVVQLGDEWIRFEPRGKSDSEVLVAAEIGEQLDPWHFGPLLDISQIGADRLEFQISRSKGVSFDARADSLRFDECRELGLCLRRWKEQFGEDLAVADLDGGDLRLELAAIRQADADMARDSDLTKVRRPLDLDPEPVVVDASFRSHFHAVDPMAPDPWSDLHDAASSTSSESTPNLYLNWIPGKAAQLRRAIFNFDTSALDEPLEAYFKLHRVGAAAGENRLIDGGYGESALSTASHYGAIEDNVAAHTIGAMTEPVANTLCSPELVAGGWWDSLSKLRFGLMQAANDFADSAPAGSENLSYSYTASGDNAPRLELTYPASATGGGTSTSTGAGRRRRR